MIARRYTSQEMKSFKVQVHRQLIAAGLVELSWAGVEAVAYTAIITLPTRSSDLDNRVKALQDAVMVYLGVNDNRVAEMHLLKIVDRETIGVEMTIRAMEPAVINPLKWLMGWVMREQNK